MSRLPIYAACLLAFGVAVVKHGLPVPNSADAQASSDTWAPSAPNEQPSMLAEEKEDDNAKKKGDKVAVIIEPKKDAKVGEAEELEGEVKVEGWPVVLINPDLPGQKWWVQETVKKLEKGAFTVPVRFGDAQTKSGTKFKIVIVVVKTRSEAVEKYKTGQTLDSKPAGVPSSNIVKVTRE